MVSTQDTSFAQRLGRLAALVGVGAAAVFVVSYLSKASGAGQSSSRDGADVKASTPQIVPTTSGTPGGHGGDVRQHLPGSVSPTEDAVVQRIYGETTVRALEELTVSELYRLAQRHDIPGRSNMRKAQLLQALHEHAIRAAEH